MRQAPVPAIPAAITVRSASDGAIIMLAISGIWDVGLRAETFRVLRRCLDAHPAGLLVDLTTLQDRDASSVRSWTSARSLGAAMQPPTLVALCVSPEALLARRMQEAGVGEGLPVYAKCGQARTALDNRIPSADRLVTHLTPTPNAPSAARRLVDEACRVWHLWHLRFSARLVVSELVTNAVKHAGTDICVTVSRRAERLHVIVSDNDHRLPELPPRRRGRSVVSGLEFVQAVSTRWGTLPTADGKMIWAAPRAV
jgi:hypothetical protein